MNVSFIITVGRITRTNAFVKGLHSNHLRKQLNYILIQGEDELEKYNNANPFWGCCYLKFDALKIIKQIFKENPKHIVFVKTGDGPDGKFFESKRGKVDLNKIRIKDFDSVDQQFYRGKFPGCKVYGKHFGAGDDT